MAKAANKIEETVTDEVKPDALPDAGTENDETQSETAPEKFDFLKLIGKNLHLAKAKHIFGAANALQAMHTVARAGKHGMFTDDHFKAQFFGGLQIPHVTKAMEDDQDGYEDQIKHVEATRAKINNALNSVFKNFQAKNQPDGE